MANERRPGDAYDVGFARPPKTTRWTKGQSGNPRGRPKAKVDPVAEQLAVLQEKVAVVVDGEPQTVTLQTALVMKLREAALRGEVWAEKMCRQLVEHSPEPAPMQLASVEEILADVARDWNPKGGGDDQDS